MKNIVLFLSAACLLSAPIFGQQHRDVLTSERKSQSQKLPTRNYSVSTSCRLTPVSPLTSTRHRL